MSFLLLTLTVSPLSPIRLDSIPCPRLKTGRDLEKEFEISRKARRAARNAAQTVRKVDSDLNVRQRAREAAKRAVRAAQKADKDLRVRERASGAAKTAEQASLSGLVVTPIHESLRAHAGARRCVMQCEDSILDAWRDARMMAVILVARFLFFIRWATFSCFCPSV